MASIAILLTLGAALSWALTAVLMKLGVTSMTRIGFAAVRPWLGLAFVLPYALLMGTLDFGSPRLVAIAMGGSFLNAVLGTALFYYAITHAPLHQASILSNTAPFWGVLSFDSRTGGACEPGGVCGCPAHCWRNILPY